jgi:hypothetical protein
MRFKDAVVSLYEGVEQMAKNAPLTTTAMNVVAFGSVVFGSGGVGAGIYGTALAIGAVNASKNNWMPASKLAREEAALEAVNAVEPAKPKM